MRRNGQVPNDTQEKTRDLALRGGSDSRFALHVGDGAVSLLRGFRQRLDSWNRTLPARLARRPCHCGDGIYGSKSFRSTIRLADRSGLAAPRSYLDRRKRSDHNRIRAVRGAAGAMGLRARHADALWHRPPPSRAVDRSAAGHTVPLESTRSLDTASLDRLRSQQDGLTLQCRVSCQYGACRMEELEAVAE